MYSEKTWEKAESKMLKNAMKEALDDLKEGKKALFIGALASCVIVNYYLSYMIVVFLLLYVFVWLILTKDKAFAGNFCVSCFLAMLLSAVVWLPSLLQYFSSGRTTSILDNLRSSSVFTAYQTTFPTVFSILFLFPFLFFKNERAEQDNRLRKILFWATLVPIVFEPINKMWQTGEEYLPLLEELATGEYDDLIRDIVNQDYADALKDLKEGDYPQLQNVLSKEDYNGFMNELEKAANGEYSDFFGQVQSFVSDTMTE